MKSYMITSNPLCGDQIKKHMPDYVLYRNKTDENYSANAFEFLNTCNKFDGVSPFLHQDVELALQLGAEGIHLTSEQFDKIQYAKEKGLEVIISTHNVDEVRKAKELGADAVTYSPIFYTPHKGEPKGVEDLKKLLSSVDIKVIALGGITSENELKQIRDTGVYGFASIRYFS